MTIFEVFIDNDDTLLAVMIQMLLVVLGSCCLHLQGSSFHSRDRVFYVGAVILVVFEDKFMMDVLFEPFDG